MAWLPHAHTCFCPKPRPGLLVLPDECKVLEMNIPGLEDECHSSLTPRVGNPEGSWLPFPKFTAGFRSKCSQRHLASSCSPHCPSPLSYCCFLSPALTPMSCALKLLSQGLLLATAKLRRPCPGTTQILACRSGFPAQAPRETGSATDQGLGLLGFAPLCQAQAKLLRGAHKCPFTE